MEEIVSNNSESENTPDETEAGAKEIAAAEAVAPDETAEETEAIAPPLSRAEEKKLAYKYLIFAAIALAGIYAAQIFHVFDKLFDFIYYGNLTRVFFYACNVIFWIPFIIVFNKQLFKRTGWRAIKRGKEELSLKRILIIYACTIVPIIIVSAALGFKLKIVYELGTRVTGMQLLSNAITYVHGGVKLIIAVMIIELVQEAVELLYRGKYSKVIPWGGIALAVVYGLTEVLVAYLSGTYSGFAWLYIGFDLLYGVLYLLSKKNFPVTYFVSLIIYIL